MKKFIVIFLFLPSFLLASNIGYNLAVTKTQVFLTGRNLKTSLWNTGVFNQMLGDELSPSLQWPEGSGKFLCLSAGLCIGAYLNGSLHLANISYNGEFVPGYNITNNGLVIPKTSESFHLYKVTRGDDARSNPDYANWGLMLNKNVPFDDVNFNGSYDVGIDIPGMKGAYQTIFICMTDGFSESHSVSEGFSGGTAPLFAELRITQWNYDNPGYEDMQFMKFDVVNCNPVSWDKTYLSLFYHPQIGDSLDDYIGCDTARRLGFAYNRDNQDGTGSGNSYGANPPAVGMKLLKTYGNDYGMTSFHPVIGPQFEACPPCEELPYTPLDAYNFMKGNKKDNTLWLDASQNPTRPTKFVFSGDPETGTGWNESVGVIGNCSGSLTGPLIQNQSLDRIFMMSTGADNYTIPKYTGSEGYAHLFYAQLVARGSNNKNSVTKLKLLSDKAQHLSDMNFIIGINPISTIVPDKFSLYQNYPNPFNPSTKIKFNINKYGFTSLIVYDSRGREVGNFINQSLSTGTYEYQFNASELPSGIYFYQLKSAEFVQTKKMILVK